MCRKALFWGMVCVLLISGLVEAAESQSVFAVASHSNGKIKAYLMDPNGSGVIHYQATIAETENFGGGATGLCLWPAKDRMFTTYEQGGGIIAWASIKNLSRNPATDEYVTGITGGNGRSYRKIRVEKR